VLEGKAMKKALLVMLLAGFPFRVFAGEAFVISAYGKVGIIPGNLQYNYINLVVVSPINCNGTSTDKIRISVESNPTGLGQANGGFLSMAEIVAAAKSELVIETVGALSFNAAQGGCQVSDYFIHVL
jgi:hypothetical protein